MYKVRRNNPELMALEGEIGRTKAMIGGLRERQTDVRKRVDETAKNGQELAGAADRPTTGSRRSTTSTLSHVCATPSWRRGLEGGLAALRFDLVEGATLPTHAASPNRPLLALGALLLAIALGLGVGFALDANDSTHS